jgi:hypothetical protein
MQLRPEKRLLRYAMTNYSRALIPLCQCFGGSFPRNPDWTLLLGLSNQTLTTTHLMPFVQRHRDRIPTDVRHYVSEVFSRNLARNDRLATQLEEAVLTINERGITPTLLKGAAILATSTRADIGSWMMSDLDIMIPADNVAEAMAALASIGYKTRFEANPKSNKWYADLGRPMDVGMLDLHRSLPGPAFFYPEAEDLQKHFKLTRIGRAEAYLPSTTFHALIMIIHDQFQDYDYWLGAIDLRHLLNLRYLSSSSEGIDWDALISLAPDRLARNALETQLHGLSVLFQADVPQRLRRHFTSRVQFKRRLAQTRFPILRMALLPLALLDYRNYRAGLGEWHHANGNDDSRRYILPKKKNIRFLIELARRRHVGKV